ncbi:MAG: tRNA pseudouridine(13) synthase TruD [Deltaproteobacteria bacterium]|nr:tRNA pseudouridine(13) synthase TruD [Deltaproteobacteria bacterium]
MPLLTPDLPGTGGALRVTEADFRVEEVPLYAASGQGDHLYVTVEKTGRTTNEVSRELAQALGTQEREVGAAGLKDKRAVTVQRLSVPLPKGTAGTQALDKDEAFRQLALAATGQGWRVLEAARHVNKLKPGHLAGNRFVLIVRGVLPHALFHAQAVLASLAKTGAANLFGPQRFGMRGDNASLGALILQRAPEASRASRDKFLRRLALSALQAELFNRNLAARISAGTLHQALLGDVLKKRASGGLFVCTDPATDTPRVQSAELDPAGPLPGHSFTEAQAEVGAQEAAIIAEAGLDPASFKVGGGEMEGTRRPYRVPVQDAAVTALGDEDLKLEFTLPPGSFALAVAREVVKGGQTVVEE